MSSRSYATTLSSYALVGLEAVCGGPGWATTQAYPARLHPRLHLRGKTGFTECLRLHSNWR